MCMLQDSKQHFERPPRDSLAWLQAIHAQGLQVCSLHARPCRGRRQQRRAHAQLQVPVLPALQRTCKTEVGNHLIATAAAPACMQERKVHMLPAPSSMLAGILTWRSTMTAAACLCVELVALLFARPESLQTESCCLQGMPGSVLRGFGC